MDTLEKAVADVAARIKKHSGSKRLNEENTKATLIEPVLRALGWNTEDLDEVQREYKVKRRDRPVDYALLELRTPRLLIEAKALGEDLTDRRWTSQIMGYATVAGVEWTLLTNGDEYRLYNSHAAVAVDEKLFRAVRISDRTPYLLDTLRLLSKERLAENRIQVLWRAHFVDRKVRAAIEDLLSPSGGAPLARVVRKMTSDLSLKEIRSSLARCQAVLTFPVDAGVPVKSTKSAPRATKASGRPKRGTTTITLSDLIAAGLLLPRTRLVRTYKQKELTATVNADGSVAFGQKSYPAPSAAGGAARATIIGRAKDGRLPPTNGWTFWLVKAASGALVPLEAIRDQYKADGGSGKLRLVEGE